MICISKLSSMIIRKIPKQDCCWNDEFYQTSVFTHDVNQLFPWLLMQKYSTYVVQLPLNLFHFVILILTEKYLTFLVDPDFVKKYCQLCDKDTSSKNWLLLWFINSFINWTFASLPEVVFLIQIWWLQPLYSCAFPPSRDTTEPL